MNTQRQKCKINFESPLNKIPGIGPKRVAALEAVGVTSVMELLRRYPARYIDRSQVVKLCDIDKHADQTVTVIGKVVYARRDFFGRPKYRVTIKDDSGAAIDALWYVRLMKIAQNETLLLTGKVLSNRTKFLMIHPTLEKITDSENYKKIIPVYTVREVMRDAGINQKLLRNVIEWIIENITDVSYPAILPREVEKKKNFPKLEECLKNVHMPVDINAVNFYMTRLKYEELYALALDLRWNKRKFALPGFAMNAGKLYDTIKKMLPFELTESQHNALKILYDDAAKPLRMHRLLQGDVGSGKTVVALLASMPAINSGKQVAWMAPTEVLAKQTLQIVQKYLLPQNISVGYLGSGDVKEKRETREKIASGELRFVVGTHALFMPSVRFKNLGMIVIDEQHKFGSAQRMKLQEKGASADFLMMSATPIPQTLAKTLYGDLDIVEIAARPSRAEVTTHVVPSAKYNDMERFIAERIKNGERVFYVAPRIENDDDDEEDGNGDAPQKNNNTFGKTLTTVDAVAEKLSAGVLFDVPIYKLHGRMPQDERETAIANFKEGAAGILVSTTIIEVGVDIRGATVIVIENPDYFGLAQLHQMRGRVGRGDLRSYCFLLLNETLESKSDDISMKRLKFLCECNDGFEIAEWDLRNRGPGESYGCRQTGWDDLCAAAILENPNLFDEVLAEVDGQFR